MAVGPNDDPNFEHRLLLAFALCVLLFLVVLPFLNKKTAPPAAPGRQPSAPAATVPPPSAGQAGTPATTAAPAAPEAAQKPAAPRAPAPVAQAATEQTLTVDTPVFHVVFSNHGAGARSWILTQYKDDNGKPLELVDTTLAARAGFPLQYWTSDAATRQALTQALFQMTATRDADGSQTVDFHWSNGSLQASQEIRFEQGYVAQIECSVTRDGQPVEAALAWPGGFGDRAVPGDFGTQQLLFQSGNGVQKMAAKSVNQGAVREGQYQFVGLEDKYFAAVFLPQGDSPATTTLLKTTYRPRLEDASGNVTSDKDVETVGLALAMSPVITTRLFVGPKKIDLLKSIDPALRGLVDFGWFTFIAEPLFLWMNWTYVHWIPNYGWAILFLTFVITMATFPLKMKAQKSQAKMMAIQPKMNALNAKMKRYGMRDPRRQEVQAEIMKMYSEHGVNPLGGCLPMLIQLPLIYAFWRVLDYAIELRHAPWIGYIHDLSAKDPYFVLPLLVVVTQFFISAMMPTMPGQDPRQAKMMKWMMPIFMGWFFFYLPTGVNLYYLGYNVISTGQQWVANRTYNEAAVAAVMAQDKAKREQNQGKKGAGQRVIEGKAIGDKR